ncbi:hypothetical protein IEQ34_020813 [Dendrobium chrysotoxum]|uniref:Uncharacterized protein n=1 Tax=Dendrobium chrysotoxum TaxID=161865 RepID=A0AAV7G193_DENCH|nr:hypothetical protein IEQ34_020813 [Dendrobium chrysotoxum]
MGRKYYDCFGDVVAPLPNLPYFFLPVSRFDQLPRLKLKLHHCACRNSNFRVPSLHISDYNTRYCYIAYTLTFLSGELCRYLNLLRALIIDDNRGILGQYLNLCLTLSVIDNSGFLGWYLNLYFTPSVDDNGGFLERYLNLYFNLSDVDKTHLLRQYGHPQKHLLCFLLHVVDLEGGYAEPRGGSISLYEPGKNVDAAMIDVYEGDELIRELHFADGKYVWKGKSIGEEGAWGG